MCALIGVLFAIAATGGAEALAASGSLTAQLTVSNHNPRQLRGIMFDASGSSGPIAYYDFVYGDGVSEVTYQPYMMHAYHNVGTYHATVYVLDASGDVAHSSSVTIHVRDGIPPVVAIDSPRSGQRIVVSSGGFTLRGTATDAGGVQTVQLAIQLTTYPPHFKVPSSYCVWYNNRTTYLVASACGNPYYFDVPYANGRWSFKLPAKPQAPSGTYYVRVRATDHAGNVSSFFALPLHTITPFSLVTK
jgi:hypothetical protein